MAGPKPPCCGCLLAFVLLVLCCTVSVIAAEGGVTTSAEKDVPQWASSNALHLTLSTKPGLQFTIIPLTENLGLNESQRSRGIVRLFGNMRPVNVSNYDQITTQDIAYLACDKPSGDGFIDPNKMLNALMGRRPVAIVLYSASRNWCSISDDETLPYTSILTMADAGEATNVLSFLNGTGAISDVKATISGNATDDQPDNGSAGGGGGNNSAVAMSILYSITGLITLLFLVIIATGAIRAHRYPERYGPRSAFGGRPRQSRAKGLARAVLDTLPIVKFGHQRPAKPDPELELDAATTDGLEVATQRTLSNLGENGRLDVTAALGRDSRDSRPSQSNDQAVSDDGQTGGGQLGCSICTEDFKEGEDVRVLPCNHQFHPSCIDPWLVNVSGTCPLCRLDLQPGQGNADNSGPTGGEGDSLAPPLALEGDEGQAATSSSHGGRFSRLLDTNRLRQATVEERMEALRQMRAETNEGDGEHEAHDGGDGPGRFQRARLTAKLKEKFRIRTRSQRAAERRDG